MLTVAPGGNNLATICYKDFLGLATINMYYYYYYYYYYSDLIHPTAVLYCQPYLKAEYRKYVNMIGLKNCLPGGINIPSVKTIMVA